METTPLRDLHDQQKDVAVKVFVLRQGKEVTTKKGNMTIRKLIFIDEHGTMIHGLIFSNVNEYFRKLLETNKWYTIYNPLIKCIDSRYSNVNPKFELNLQKSTIVTELPRTLKMPHITFEFKEFDKLANIVNTKEALHVIGILNKVMPLSNFTRPDKTEGQRRQVMLLNMRMEIISVTMWDDLAIHEGQLMKRIESEHPIVAFSNLTMQIFLNAQQLQTTATTAMILNPLCDTARAIQKWLDADQKQDNLTELWVKKELADAKQVTLDDVTTKRAMLTENNYYFIRSKIKEIENKATPWYEACDHCFQAATKTNNKASCANCINYPITIMPRYRITVVIEDENETARITLFGKVAESFVGCSIEDFILIHDQNLPNNPYKDLLNQPSSKLLTFLFKLDNSVEKRDGVLKIVAEAIEIHDNYPTTNANIKKRRSRKILNTTKQSNIPSKEEKSNEININRNMKMHEDENEIEIRDDEPIAEYQKRAKKIKINGNKKISGGLRIKDKKM